MIERMTPAERKHFTTLPVGVKGPSRYCIDWGFEPACGTLDERLGILVRRFGGTTTNRLRALTADEKAQLTGELF